MPIKNVASSTQRRQPFSTRPSPADRIGYVPVAQRAQLCVQVLVCSQPSVHTQDTLHVAPRLGKLEFVDPAQIAQKLLVLFGHGRIQRRAMRRDSATVLGPLDAVGAEGGLGLEDITPAPPAALVVHATRNGVRKEPFGVLGWPRGVEIKLGGYLGQAAEEGGHAEIVVSCQESSGPEMRALPTLLLQRDQPIQH